MNTLPHEKRKNQNTKENAKESIELKECFICGELKQMIKGHLIPKGLRVNKQDKTVEMDFKNKEDRLGDIDCCYEWCDECEKTFSAIDEFITQFVRDLGNRDGFSETRNFENHCKLHNINDAYRLYSIIDYNLIDRFAISVLMRYHIATQRKCDNVKTKIDLGDKYYDLAKDILYNNHKIENFETLMYVDTGRTIEVKELLNVIAVSRLSKNFKFAKGLNVYEIILPHGLTLICKCDKKQFDNQIKEFFRNDKFITTFNISPGEATKLAIEIQKHKSKGLSKIKDN